MDATRNKSKSRLGGKQLDPLRLERYQGANQKRDEVLQHLGLHAGKSRTKLFIRETIAAFQDGHDRCVLDRGDALLKDAVRERGGKSVNARISDEDVAEALKQVGGHKVSGNAITQWRKNGRIPEKHHDAIAALIGSTWKPSDRELGYASQISAARFINKEIFDGNERHPLSPERIEMILAAMNPKYSSALGQNELSRLEKHGGEIVRMIHNKEDFQQPYDVLNPADLRAVAVLWLDCLFSARVVHFTELSDPHNAEGYEGEKDNQCHLTQLQTVILGSLGLGSCSLAMIRTARNSETGKISFPLSPVP